ncbi:hypothetical protein DP806_16725 [Salmonella enterica subsp. enterica serovar Saintpaul]|nr:hypothetical protein [Salmonella enterica subsp. enterica serovar Saintpaul]
MSAKTSEKIKILLPMMREALLSLGHEKIWFRDSGPKPQMITWDGFVVAQLNPEAGSWEILPGANGTFSNPKGTEPDDATELTEAWAFQLSTMYS